VKKFLLLALLFAGLTLPVSARAQSFGQYTTAEILAVNTRLTGAYVDASEKVTGFIAQLRLSFYPNIDFGFQGGLGRVEDNDGDKTALRLGADVRYGIAKTSAQFPVDIAAGVCVGVETTDRHHVLTLGPSAVASRTFTFSNNTSLAPYAGVMLAFANYDLPDVTKQMRSTPDTSVPLRLGAELRAIPGVRITAEFQARLGADYADRTGFAGGVNIPF